ncbi:metal ABC transporter permease [Orrella marina]|uniref:Zinc ABC transporter permease n=1 Tax=Orrella marina TaxID=2163011 RepID=A0A2R4XLA2_9BURK|nr:metal ABC transporter permease [Orrella marina]AWB34572.1 zinc ABC transporter permease [Orrella marina]
MMQELFWIPFAEFGFMQRALVACLALGLVSGPIGVLLVMRRMSLAGDAISHSVLPGAAVGYLIAGMSFAVMGVAAFMTAMLVALMASGVSNLTSQREDASLAAFYLIALALGVAIISMNGSNVDLMHLLFGSVLAVDRSGLILVAGAVSLALVVLALIWRPLLAGSFDPLFVAQHGKAGRRATQLFMFTVVLTFVASFQTLGTLMAVGLLMLPATAARFWVRDISRACALASLMAMASGAVGLLVSYHASVPSGPAIVLTAGCFYLISLLAGTHDSLLAHSLKVTRHKES